MNTKDVADRLVAFCKEGKYEECYEQLYSPNCISIEPAGAAMEVCEGLEQIAAKGIVWTEQMKEFHGSSVGEATVSGRFFTVPMMIDYTGKDDVRVKMEEICVYEVHDGKIILEQFFF